MPGRAEGDSPLDAERLFHDLVDAAPDAMLVIEQGAPHYLVANAAAERLLGYGRAELLTLGPRDILDPVELPRVPEIRRQFEQAGYWRGEWLLRRKDGTVVPVEATNTRHEVGGRRLYQSVFRDITERKQAEVALARREAQLAEAQRIAHVGSWEWDTATDRLYWSDEHYRLMGLEPQASTITMDAALAMIHPEDRELTKTVLAACLQKGESYERPIRIVRPDGAVRVLNSRGTVLRDSAGQFARMVGTAQDITERARAEAEAERARQEKLALLDSTSEGIFGLDLAGRCTFLNRSGAAMFGYAPDEVVGQDMHLLVHHRHADGAPYPKESCPIRRTIQTGEAVRLDDEVMWRRDGIGVPVEYASAPVLEDGHITGVVVTVTDISERKQTEDALRESEERFRSSFEHAAIGKALLALDGRWLQVNAALCDLTGYSREELLARRFQDITHPEDLAIDLGYAGQLLAGEIRNYHLEKRYCHKRGHVVWGLLSGSLLRGQDGQPRFFLAEIQDITERKRAEDALRESEGRLRQVAEHVDEVFWMSDPHKGQILYISPAYERIWGRSSASLLAEPRSWIEVIHPEDRARVCRAALTQQVSGEYDEIYRIVRPEGAIRWVHDRAFPVRDVDGQVYRVLGVAADVTDSKLAEVERERLLASEQAALAELRATQQQVVQQERLRALGQMASGIAHDFNNALSPIVAYTDLLLAAPGKLSDQQRVASFLEMIQTAAEDAAGIVRRLREFYRQRDDDQVVVPVNLEGLIAQVVSLTQFRWKDQAQARGATISITIDVGDTRLVAGDPSDLREALTNLIFNAVDAMPQGGALTFGVREEGDAVVLSVRDTGVGMTEAVRLRCLEPFFTTKRDHGTGLGLGLVYGIVQRHQGSLEIESTPGAGTTVHVRLPIWSESAPDLTTSSQHGTARPLRVLVVEDEPMIRHAYREYLSTDGHTVEIAPDGQAALEMIRSGTFDLVMTDRALPGICGDQVAAVINQLRPGLPIIMVTGFGDLMNRRGERPDGVDLVMSKPLTLVALRSAIAQVTAEHGPPWASGGCAGTPGVRTIKRLGMHT